MAQAPVRASTPLDGAQSFLTDFAKRGESIIKSDNMSDTEKKTELRDMLANGFDIRTVGQFVLGRYRRGLDADQLKEYDQLYFEYVLATYFDQMSGIGDWRFNISEVRQVEEDAVVSSIVNRKKGDPLRVDWRIRRYSGEYRIVDVLFEGVSLAVTQRSDFNAVLARGGYGALRDALRKKIGQ